MSNALKLGLGALGLAALLGLALYAMGEGGRNQTAAPPAEWNQADLAATYAAGEMAAFEFAERPGPAPSGTFTDAGGAAMTLEDFRGKVVLVNFWATWCAPCLVELPALARLADNKAGADFAVLAISTDRKGLDFAQDFLEKRGIAAPPVYSDATSMMAGGAGIRAMPTTVLIGADGQELGRLGGAAEWDSAEAKALISWAISRR